MPKVKRKASDKKQREHFYDKVIANIFTKTIKGPHLAKGDSGLTVWYPIFATGFDTLKIGLPKERDYFDNHRMLLGLCETIDATLHQVKYTDEADHTKVLITDNKLLHAFYYKKYKGSISAKFYKSYGAWIIEYKGSMHWVINWISAKQLSLELYGLSQLDHDKGQVRFELLNKILEYYSDYPYYNKPILNGYDFAIDLNQPYEYMYTHFLVPYAYIKNKTLRRGKHKLYTYEGSKGSSVYLQDTSHKGNRQIIMYDKKAKNDLDELEALCRFEIRVRLEGELDKITLNSYDELSPIAWKELSEIGLISQEDYKKYTDEIWLLLYTGK